MRNNRRQILLGQNCKHKMLWTKGDPRAKYEYSDSNIRNAGTDFNRDEDQSDFVNQGGLFAKFVLVDKNMHFDNKTCGHYFP